MKNLGASLISAVVLSMGAASVEAATLLSVGGTVDSGANIGTGGVEAVAISFTLATDQADLSLSAPITCFSCTGGLYLHSSSLGSMTGVGDLITATSFDTNSLNPFFSDFNLGAGLYFMILEISNGFAIWEGSTAPVVSASFGVTAGPDFVSTDVSGFVPTSPFSILNFGGGLSFELTQADIAPPAAVPLLPTVAFSVFGLLSFAMFRRKT